MKKKILSLLLFLAMLLSLLPVSALAAESFSDTRGHWAADAIDRWSGYGVVNGKDNGSFDPNGQMTRAEAAQVFANLLGLNKEGDISAYPDAQNDWYSSAIAKCVAAGILNGKGVGVMDSNGTITREEFLTMYARAVCLSEGVASAEAKSELAQKGFTDTAKVSDWAADSVKTLVDKGYVNGVSATELAPQNNIDRASVMALLNQSISTYVGKNSTETTVTAKSEGITLIANPAVTDITGTADVVVVAAGAEQYDKTTGEIEHNDIRVESAKMPVARVQGENITVTLAVNSEVQDAAVTSTGEKSEIVVDKTAKVGKLTIAAESAKAIVAGTVETVAVAETAKDAIVDTKSTAKVEIVENKAENTTVTGSGTVSEVKSSEDVKVETKNTAVANTSETKEIAVTDSKGTATKVETTTNASAGAKTETTVNQPISTGGSSGGGSSAHSHTYSADWTYDDTYHWHVATCAHTSEVSDKAAHVDANGDGTCDVCLRHAHLFSSAWTYDDTYHWHAATCAHTTEKSDKAAHVYANQGDTVCSVCHHGAVAIIGDVYYGSLDTAVTSVKAGETITLLKDCATGSTYDENNPLALTKDNVTLDLNGKTITETVNFSFVIAGNKDTVKNGKIEAGANAGKTCGYNSYALIIANLAHGQIAKGITVENVTFKGGVSAGGDADTAIKGGAYVTLNDCTVTAGDFYAVYAQQNSKVAVTSGAYSRGGVHGTTLSKEGDSSITVTGGTFGEDVSAYCAPGYGATKNENNTYTVGYMFALKADGTVSTGSEEDPFLISDYKTMQKITNLYHSGNYYFKVATADTVIDCTGWSPVWLHGSFDGNGATFNNVTACLFQRVGYQLENEEITLKNFTAVMNTCASQQYGVGSMIKQIDNAGTTTFDNINVSGTCNAFWNVSSFYSYGTANYDDVGCDYTVKFNNCHSNATLICTTGNTCGGFVGHVYEGAGHGASIYFNNSDYTGTIYTVNAPGGKYFAMSSDYYNANNHFYIDNEEQTPKSSYRPAWNVYSGNANITKVVPTSGGSGYTVAVQEGVAKVTVAVNAQLTAYKADNTTEISNLSGITMILATKELTDVTSSTVLLDNVTSATINNAAESYGYSLSDGAMTVNVPGNSNYRKGTVRLTVSQYDANGNIISCGTVDVITINNK